MPSSNPTTGLGVAAAVTLSGTGVVQEKAPLALTQGIARYQVTLSKSGVSFPNTVVVTSTAIDVAGNIVATGLPAPLPPSQLGSAANYELLAAAGVTNSDGAGTTINGGNIGSSPTATYVPGTPAWTLGPGVSVDTPDAAAAQTAALAAYNFYSALTFTSLSGSSANLSVLGNGSTASTYTPGNYSAGSSMDIPTSITLDAQGNPNAVFVFKAGSTVTLESNASVLLVNGAQAGNVYWIVGSSFTSIFGTVSVMNGNILANTSITLGGGILNGRALAGIVTTSGAITIATATVMTVPVLAAPASLSNGWNAVSYNAWPKKVGGVTQNLDGTPRNQQDVIVSYPAPTTTQGGIADVTDDSTGNPFTVTAYNIGQAVVEFQIPTFLNTIVHVDNEKNLTDGFPQEFVYAQLLVNVVA